MRSLRVGKFTIAVVTAVVCVLGASRGYAVPIVSTYTTAASFDAVTTDQNTVGFSSSIPCPPCYQFANPGSPQTYSTGGITFTTTDPDGLNLNLPSLYTTTPPYPSEFLSNVYYVPPNAIPIRPDTLTITLSTAVTAFALDFTTPEGVNVTFGLGNGFTTTVSTTAFGQPQFEGFVSNTPFDTITLTDSLPNGWFVFDVTTATAAVPEPSTWAMIIIGFLGLGLLAHRRGKNDAASFA
jgi:hypothetical protein